jgi:hypothetical protein
MLQLEDMKHHHMTFKTAPVPTKKPFCTQVDHIETLLQIRLCPVEGLI